MLIEITPAQARFTSEIRLLSPAPRVIGTSKEIGKIVNLGKFEPGVELIFGIFVLDTGYAYSMGPGSQNPDGIVHAAVNCVSPGVATIGFEDQFNGGDKDTNDVMFQVQTGPEASTLRFSAAAYNVAEHEGAAQITVIRAGNAASAVSVDYATTNGTATGAPTTRRRAARFRSPPEKPPKASRSQSPTRRWWKTTKQSISL
ncbi:MAG: Calx-beta domain-containing protein [Pyrinomonadaceae bacterium]